MKKIRLDVVTPGGTAYGEEIDSLVAPAFEGMLGVLPGHAPLLCTLAPGDFKIIARGGEEHFSVSGGFMEVTPTKVTVLAEAFESAGRIDVDRARRAEDRARKRLAEATRDRSIDAARAESALDRARNRLKVAGGRARV